MLDAWGRVPEAKKRTRQYLSSACPSPNYALSFFESIHNGLRSKFVLVDALVAVQILLDGRELRLDKLGLCFERLQGLEPALAGVCMKKDSSGFVPGGLAERALLLCH